LGSLAYLSLSFVILFSEDQTTAITGCTGSSRRLSFGSIQVREYELVITNDDPWLCIGLGLGGWNYQEEDAVPIVDDYVKMAACFDGCATPV
jgi:hypothetical protein